MRRHAVIIAGHRTSVSVEDAFWAALKQIADTDQVSLNQLITTIDAARTGNLSSAIRVHVLQQVQRRGEVSAGTA